MVEKIQQDGKPKTVIKITEWNLRGMRSKGLQKYTYSDEVLNGLKELKMKNCTYVVKERKIW
jgi:hypothetical protein